MFLIVCDYHWTDDPELADSFTVVQLTDGNGLDYGFLLGADKPYYSLESVRQDIAGKLNIDPQEVELEEV